MKKMEKKRANELMMSLCRLLNRNDDLTMQIDYFEYENMSEIEYCIDVLKAMQEDAEFNTDE